MNYPIEKFDVYTLNVGYSCNNADWNWKNIQSPFARLYLVLNGKAKIVLPDGTYELTLGTCTLSLPIHVIAISAPLISHTITCISTRNRLVK